MPLLRPQLLISSFPLNPLLKCETLMRCNFANCISRRYTHGGRSSHSLLWLSNKNNNNNIDSINTIHDIPNSLPKMSKSQTKITSSSLLYKDKKNSSSFNLSKPSSHSSSPPLLLDPPFTPIPGEAEALQEANNNNNNETPVLLYICRACSTPLFCSTECVKFSKAGQHTSGWPSFTSPINNSVLRLRSLLQRSALSLIDPKDNNKNIIIENPLRATLAARGLRVEGEMIRLTRGGKCGLRQTNSWREECLRDENKRSDPILTEGICVNCEKSICRVVLGRKRGGGGVIFVVNPTAIMAILAE